MHRQNEHLSQHNQCKMFFLQWVSHPKPRENKWKRVEEIVQVRRKEMKGPSFGVANWRSFICAVLGNAAAESAYAGVKTNARLLLESARSLFQGHGIRAEVGRFLIVIVFSSHPKR